MINKKLVGTALIGLMTVGFVTQASAAVIDRGDGFTDVDAVNEAKMKVNGTLGETDNTNPGENIPEGDDAWINVTIPTAVVFQASDSQVIYSPAYEIKNNSGRGVKVSVKEYNITNNVEGLAALSQLNIVNTDDDNTVKLAENGATAVAAEQEFGSIKVGEDLGFKFTGNVDKDGLSSEKDENRVESNVVFGFKAIPKN